MKQLSERYEVDIKEAYAAALEMLPSVYAARALLDQEELELHRRVRPVRSLGSKQTEQEIFELAATLSQ